jgi:hypothetical protein
VTSGFGALLQGLPGGRERVLAAGLIAEKRAEDERFKPGELVDLFDSLKVPAPTSINEYLRRLAADRLVLRRKTGGWSLTPLGRERVDELIGEIDVDQVEAEQLTAGSSEFDGVRHPLIAPEMAPLRFRPAVDRLLDESVFERNVFCMTRFPDTDSAKDEPLRMAIATAREQLKSSGLTMHLASDRQADDELFGNVVAHIWGCKYGVAFLETLDAEEGKDQLNDNVLIEIGAMLFSGRRCCLLKDVGAPNLPTDFIAQIYKEIEISEPNAVQANLESWVRDDLQLSSRD